jgi:hypothetical protein
VGGRKRKHKHSLGNPKLKLVLTLHTTPNNSKQYPPLVASRRASKHQSRMSVAGYSTNQLCSRVGPNWSAAASSPANAVQGTAGFPLSLQLLDGIADQLDDDYDRCCDLQFDCTVQRRLAERALFLII